MHSKRTSITQRIEILSVTEGNLVISTLITGYETEEDTETVEELDYEFSAQPSVAL